MLFLSFTAEKTARDSLARFSRASQLMRPRRAVLLTPFQSTHPRQLPFYNYIALVTPLESALMEVLISKNFKSFRINTYKKHRGEGVLWLTRHPTIDRRLRLGRRDSDPVGKGVCPERPPGVWDFSSHLQSRAILALDPHLHYISSLPEAQIQGNPRTPSQTGWEQG